VAKPFVVDVVERLLVDAVGTDSGRESAGDLREGEKVVVAWDRDDTSVLGEVEAQA